MTAKAAKAPEATLQQRIRIKIRAYDHKLIDQSAKQIVDTAKKSGAEISGPIPLPTEKTKYTVLAVIKYIVKNACFSKHLVETRLYLEIKHLSTIS